MSENSAVRQPSAATVINRDLSSPTMLAQLKMALPAHVSVEKFVRTTLTAIQSNYMLMQADRTSLLKACLEAATDGLLPDGREGAIVPFRNNRANKIECQWQPMVWGLVKLVRNSGELSSIGAEIVRSTDKFDRWVDEQGPHFKHIPSLDGSGEPIGVYAYALTKDGGVYIEYMTWKEIEKFKALSKAKEGPWKDWPDEMAKVRPIKRLCKRLPMSTDAIAAMERDDARDARAAEGTAVDPIAALNGAISGAAQPEPAPPAITHDPSPSFNDLAGSISSADAGMLVEIRGRLQQVENAEDRQELEGMIAVRDSELAGASTA